MVDPAGRWLPPEGLCDTLPDEYIRAANLRDRVSKLFVKRGYRGIETPIFESLGLFRLGNTSLPDDKLWKTQSPDGSILVIRPDNTTPAVRLACASLKNCPLPIRLHYIQPVLRYRGDMGDQPIESRQAGVELLGETAPCADAEVIALAIEALRSSGLDDFLIDIGHVGFFKGLMEESGLLPDECERLRSLVESKNSLAITLALNEAELPSDEDRSRIASRLQTLPMLFGDIKVLDKAREMSSHPTCQSAIDNVKSVFELLSKDGLARYLSIDLGMVHSINYYTGIVFRGLSGHLGRPLLSGGRYDALPAALGRPMGAVGFAIKMESLNAALEKEASPARPAIVSKSDGIVTLAVAKGRLALDTFARLEAYGIDCSAARDPGRRLIVDDPTGRVRFMLVKPVDVPTYVDHGVADAGIVGKDTLMEQSRPLYELLDLNTGLCRLCIAGDPARHEAALYGAIYRVATKYPNIAREFYRRRGQPIEIIPLSGSVELAPIVGLSDVILDIVESGGTLQANGLAVLEEICHISARLVVNHVSLKTKTELIRMLIGAFERG